MFYIFIIHELISENSSLNVNEYMFSTYFIYIFIYVSLWANQYLAYVYIMSLDKIYQKKIHIYQPKALKL